MGLYDWFLGNAKHSDANKEATEELDRAVVAHKEISMIAVAQSIENRQRADSALKAAEDALDIITQTEKRLKRR